MTRLLRATVPRVHVFMKVQGRRRRGRRPWLQADGIRVARLTDCAT